MKLLQNVGMYETMRGNPIVFKYGVQQNEKGFLKQLYLKNHFTRFLPKLSDLIVSAICIILIYIIGSDPSDWQPFLLLIFYDIILSRKIVEHQKYLCIRENRLKVANEIYTRSEKLSLICCRYYIATFFTYLSRKNSTI